jgi:microcystin-dependent protein
MALVGSQTAGFDNTFLPASGQLISVSTNNALYALIGNTYGGNSTQFNLPDLQGRVVLGAGTYTGVYGPINYPIGQKSGAPYVALTTSNIPPHAHTLTTGASGVVVNTGPGSLGVTVGLGSLTATTSLSAVTASAAGSGLTLNASSGGTTTNAPSGASLTTPVVTTKIYSDAAPSIGMKAGSITGTAPVTFTGNPTTTLSGNPAASMTGAPAVSISGQTGSVGTGNAFSILPPYVAMRYFIAVYGVWPTPN